MLERGCAIIRSPGGRRLRDVIAIAIFALTILGVLTRPRSISEAAFCVAGGVLAVVIQAVPPAEALGAITKQWDVLGFFAGLLVVSWVCEQAGVFHWSALQAARLARGSGRRLFLNVFVTGIVLTTLLSNDATAILLTAVAVALAQDLKLPVKPFALACAFIANSASMTLPVSNPLNILVLGSGGAGLRSYMVHMLPASVAVVGLTVLLFWLHFRREVDRDFDAAAVPAASSAVTDVRLFRICAVVLGLLAIGYVSASAFGWPLSVPVLVAAAVLLAATAVRGSISLRGLATAPWSIIPFVAGLLVVVQGLERTGATHELGTWLLSLERHGAAAGIVGATLISAAGSNLMNNLPMGAVMLSALRTANAHGHPGLLYGTLLGSDVGPNLTVLGSLSSMLWLLLLRRRGVTITAWEFARLGLLVTPLLLIAGAAAIVLVV